MAEDAHLCFENPKRVTIDRDKETGEFYVLVEHQAGGAKKITFPRPRVRVKATSHAA